MGTSLIAGALAGYVVWIHVVISERTAKRLEALADFGLTQVFEARSTRIKPEYDARLSNVHDRIDILGFGLQALREDYADQFNAWAARAHVRILLIDPEFPTTNHTYASQRDREENTGQASISQHAREFIRIAAPAIRAHPERFQIRLYTCLPTLNVFRIDDEVLWGIYVVGRASRNTPTFVVQRGKLFDVISAHFDTIWSEFSRPIPADWLPAQ